LARLLAYVNFTDQGISSIKETPACSAVFLVLAEELGVTVKSVFWTVGY